MSKKERQRLARERKSRLRRSGHDFLALARAADKSYSLVEKWMNGLRNSPACQQAFDRLTGRESC